MGVRTANVQPGNIGETLTGLAEVIHGRRDASAEESYTARLLSDVEDELLKKLAEEASEVIMACKDNDHDHIRGRRPGLPPARDARALRHHPRRAGRRTQRPPPLVELLVQGGQDTLLQMIRFPPSPTDQMEVAVE